MPDLSTSIREYYDAAAEPVDVPEILDRSGHRRVVPNWAVAVAAALAVFVLIGGFVWLISGTDSEVIEEPMPTVTTSVPTTVPDETPVSVPNETTPTIPDATPPVVVTVPSESAAREPIDEISGVAVADGSLWASTGEGIVRWDLEGGDPELFTSAEGVPLIEGFAPRISAAPDGPVWAYAYYPQDLVAFDGTLWTEPPGYDQIDILNPRCPPDDECPNPIMAMAAGSDGVLFLALGDGTLVEFDGNVWHVLPDTPVTYAADMAVAADGTLWVASWEEVLAYDGDEWTRFTSAGGLPSGGISSVAVAPNGDVWVGTADDFEGDPSGGVARFDGGAWTTFDEADGLSASAVTALTVGSDGTVWAVHGGADPAGYGEEPGVSAVSRFNGATWSATTIADVGTGFGWGAAVDDSGTLWITSRLGIVGLNGSEATVLQVSGGDRPGLDVPDVVVPEVWDPILSTTAAGAVPTAATCPAGTDPDTPGPVDQARPDPDGGAAAFDRHRGRIVYVDGANETWTFDVCTNTWEQMNPTGSPERYPPGTLAYDVDSDRIISLRSSSSSAYDPNTNRWTPISDREAQPGDHPTGTWWTMGAVYDPVSGLVLVQYDQLGVKQTVLSAYNVDTDQWTRVGPLDGKAFRKLIGYSSRTDQLIFRGYDGGGFGVGDETGDRDYDAGPPLVVDPRTGAATATELGPPISGAWGGIHYATGTRTAYVQTEPHKEICWYDPMTLTWDNCFESTRYPDDVVDLVPAAMVGDPINNRLVLIKTIDFPPFGEDSEPVFVSVVWAIDLANGEWTQLLAPPTP